MSAGQAHGADPAGVFITGTDTGVGKTVYAGGLIRLLQRHQIPVAAMKPVAAGCRRTAEGLRNDDAEQLKALIDPALPYETVNPCALEAAAAPHLVADEQGLSIDGAGLVAAARALAQTRFTVVEGAGGWRVPLGPTQDMAALARGIGLPVVLVVGVRLGCLNHALLSAEAIRADGLVLAGWVACELDADDPRRDAQIASLDARLPAPRLGRIPVLQEPTPEQVADYLEPPPGVLEA
ncbi:dethiobiotin synthase [Halorhodospira halophila]|uniref:ATP-dependent dethiobiotin synthetase BioD n=1 Tax=Halorhodospira halophila (strain DSM 244 / SL1) TaxID=349124 RepID=A1WVM3_HALHL|nr:dethiobiotin synthase [Halorhodospira halophila]ABM61735.1 dethiobiotin synthase [Halorhodospira halophila SL1]MBK1728936.1 dethiobiotin synthase [Halorhodospira halophila]